MNKFAVVVRNWRFLTAENTVGLNRKNSQDFRSLSTKSTANGCFKNFSFITL